MYIPVICFVQIILFLSAFYYLLWNKKKYFKKVNFGNLLGRDPGLKRIKWIWMHMRMRMMYIKINHLSNADAHKRLLPYLLGYVNMCIPF